MAEELETKTSVGLETPTQTANRAKKLVSSISAKDLANPVTAPDITPPQPPPPLPSNGMVNAVREETNNIISAQTEEAKQLKDLRTQYAALGDQGSLSDLFNTETNKLGIPDDMKRLKDINLQLADMNTSSELTKTKITGGPGQTLSQGQREITQEDREQAVRSAGLAAQAAVLQGNIETGTALVNQAVNIAYQDRSLKNQNLINQINDLSGVVDDQTQQLLDQETRKYEEDQAKIKEIKDAVNTAMVSGATAQEASQLSDPMLSDEDRLSLAQSIVARGATEDRSLDRQAKQASIANVYDQMRERAVDRREKALKAVQEANSKAEVDSAVAEANTEQALEISKLATDMMDHAGLNDAVGVGFKKSVIGGIPFVSGDAVSGTSRADFEAIATRLGNLLTLDNLDLMTGVLSETDIKILESAGSNLKDFSQSEKQYKGEIQRIYDVMQRTIKNNGITEEQALFWGVLEGEDVETFNSLWETL